jgi:magnesium chelatase subunit I
VDTHYPTTVDDEMLIIVQETRVADPKNVFLPVFVVRAIAKITQMTRAHHDVNHDKGVSVRMAVHSMEMMIGESERTRSLVYGIKAVPRFCDLHCIHQSSKFELAEMDDTRENRRTLLDSVIDAALKEMSLEYVAKISPEQISKMKNEFAKNKAFQVSQVLPGGKKGEADYESQLGKFPTLRQAVNDTAAAIKEEQKQLAERARGLGIMTDNIATQDLNGEFTAAVTEVVLEGLRHIQPPLLDKKDNTYALAQ